MGEAIEIGGRTYKRKSMDFGDYCDITRALVPPEGIQEGRPFTPKMTKDNIRLMINSILSPSMEPAVFRAVPKSEWPKVMLLFKEAAEEFKGIAPDEEKKTG
jgi:hypothetical protein